MEVWTFTDVTLSTEIQAKMTGASVAFIAWVDCTLIGDQPKLNGSLKRKVGELIIVAGQSESKGMFCVVDDLASILSIEVGHFNSVMQRIGPVKLSGIKVNGQTGWEA